MPGQTTAALCESLRRTSVFLDGLFQTVSYDILNVGMIRVNLGDALQLNESCQDSLNRYRVGALPAGPYRAQ